MSKRNEAIGTVACPMKGCEQTCDVFRFRERGDSEQSVANRRFAGKLYARCPNHGQLGGGAGDADMQEYILCNATMHAPANAGAHASPPATSPAKKKPATPARAPASPVRPLVSNSPASAKESPATDTRETKIASKGWGFFS